MDTLISILVYLAVFGVSALVVQYGYRHKSRGLQIVGLFIPVVIAGLRFDVGVDYMSYLNAYADVVNPRDTLRYEGTPGLETTFRIVAHASHALAVSPVPLFMFYAAVTVFAFYAALKIMKPKNIGYSLFFFYSIFFLNSFNIMRQGAAISIGALALMEYTKGDKKKSFLLIILATLFHVSALLIFVYIFLESLLERYVLARKKIANFRRLFIKAFLIAVLIAVLGISVVAIAEFIYNATGRIGTFGSAISVGVIFKFMMTATCLYIVSYVWASFDSARKRLALFVLIGMLVYSVGIIHNESARIGMYLITLVPILAAIALDSLKSNYFKSRIFMSVGLVFLGILYIISVHFGGGDGVKYHYQSIITSTEYTQIIKEVSN